MKKKVIVPFVLAIILMGGCLFNRGPSKPVEGIYEVLFFDQKANKFVSQEEGLGSTLFHGIIRNGRFYMVSMLSGFEGRIEPDDIAWRFIVEKGSSSRPQTDVFVVETARQERELTFRLKDELRLRWVWKMELVVPPNLETKK